MNTLQSSWRLTIKQVKKSRTRVYDFFLKHTPELNNKKLSTTCFITNVPESKEEEKRSKRDG